MNLRSKVFKGTVVLTGGQAVTQFLSLIRNIIVARLLNPENMGIAAIFAITITLLEMISNLGMDIFLVQAKDGDDPALQGTAHLFQVFRGLLVGLIIFACAPFIALWFDIPQAVWAFRLVALVPVFRGFMHLDWKRLQRNMQYRTAVIVELIPQAIVVLAAFPMATWRGDYSAVLWLVIMQALAGLLVSHLIAQRPYRLNWDRTFAYRLIIFGWPLLVNGLLMFGALQGDRIIIGASYSMTELGAYSVVFSLVLMLATVIAKISTALCLPLFASVQNEQVEFRRRYILLVQVLALISGVVALPFITTGGHMVILIFGEQYTLAFSFAPWLGVLLAIRVFRLAPTIAALARGDTKNSMIANMFRLMGVAAAVLVAWKQQPLFVIVLCGIGGEFLAFMSAIFRLQRLQGIRFTESLFPPVVVFIVLFLAEAKNILIGVNTSMLVNFITCFIFIFFLVAMVLLAFPSVRFGIMQMISGHSASLVSRK